MNRRLTTFPARLAAAVLCPVAFVATACGGTQADAPPANRAADTSATLVGLYGSQATTQFDPHKYRAIGDFQGIGLVYDGLVQFGPKGEIEPMLATSWAFAPDGTSLDLRLRQGATFQDGTAIDAAAVKASLERAKTVDGSTVATRLAVITSIDVVSPTEVRLGLGPGAGNLLEILAGPPGRVVGAAGSKDISLDPGPTASGPYKVVEFQPGGRSVFERVDHYWDTTFEGPKRIETSPTVDAATRLTSIRSGSADVGSIGGHDIDLAREDRANSRNLQVEVLENSTGIHLQFDRTRAPFADVRVRQAVAYAMDKSQIPAAVYGSVAAAATQMLPAESPDAVPNAAEPFPHDPAKAKALLEQAGVGSGFSFEIACFDADFCKVAEAIQPQLAEVGITMSITRTTAADTRQRMKTHTLDAAMEGTSPVPTAAMRVESLLFTPGIDMASQGNGDGAQATALYAAALDQKASPDAVKKAYADLNRLVVEKQTWFVPMIYFHNAVIGKRNLDGVARLYDSGVMNVRALRVMTR